MFRPCIDLHEGKVKQIVGGSYRDDGRTLETHFVSTREPTWFAELFQKDQLTGGHCIMIGPGNEVAAREVLEAYPGGLQVGGGIHDGNASIYLDRGASHVILTSWLFPEAVLSWERVKSLSKQVGKSRLVVDLSCRRREGRYHVVINRWQTWTDQELSLELLQKLEPFCDELLIHSVDVEGQCRGVDWDLVVKLAEWNVMPVTYAGGARSLEDLEKITQMGDGAIHLTIGSAMDIFGGKGVAYVDAVRFNREWQRGHLD